MNEENEIYCTEEKINPIFEEIRGLVNDSRNRVYSTVNTEMLNLYWNIGKIIMEIQQGDERASYGEIVLNKLSEKLVEEFGRGFSARNLRTMRKFYLVYPIWKTVSAKLSWSHYIELIRIEEETKRNFYLKECENSRWSVRELQRQIGSLLYERLALSKDKGSICFRIFGYKGEFQVFRDRFRKNILEHLKEFMLELGQGFMFVGSQVRITLDGDHFYPDLVFYNRLLRCFVIIDLKIGEITHQDIGQMQMYVNYYDRDVKSKEENKTVGILLSTKKKETIVKYTLPEDNDSIFASEYKLHLPTEQELIDAVEEEKKNLELI